MDVQDGFILGIYNYCDRWCERCALTSRCRVFADMAEQDASSDPALKAVVEAPLLPQEVPPDPPRWMQELLAETNEAASKTLSDDHPALPPEHEAIDARAHEYLFRVHSWLEGVGWPPRRDPAEPMAVIAWFHTMIGATIHRALTGLALDVPKIETGPRTTTARRRWRCSPSRSRARRGCDCSSATRSRRRTSRS